MQFYTIVASDYDAALKQARTQYGPGVRIQSRRDFVEKHLFSAKKQCEITFYLVEKKEVSEN